MDTRQAPPQIELMPLEQWWTLLQSHAVPASLSSYLRALKIGHDAPLWLTHEHTPRQRDLVHAGLEQRKHPVWRHAVRCDPVLESLEAALIHLLVAPLLDVPRAGHQPADLIAHAMAEELGRALIAAAIVHGQDDAIGRLRDWLQCQDDTQETSP